MITIESLRTEMIDEIVARIMDHQRLVAERHRMINGWVDDVVLADSLVASAPDTLVACRNGVVVGHLRGTLLDSDLFGQSAWINPEGLSYDDELVLESLYVAGADRWLSRGSHRHYVWVPNDEVAPWLTLGFALMHQRGTKMIETTEPLGLPQRYTLRRGGIDDLAIALALDDHLDEAQSAGPSYSLHLSKTTQRDDWIETLEDPSVFHVIVEVDGAPVAQCATFALPERVGTFADSIHLSAVTVREEHRRLGVGRAMVNYVLDDAARRGFQFAETNWRVTNRRAARYWVNYGFEPTYVRLHRNVGIA